MTDNEQPSNKSHSLADHAFGAALGHVHAPDEEHDHDHDPDDNLIEAGSQALARVELVSMGIDIGSSGTQIAFSRLFMHGPGEPMAMRRKIKSRETLYLSPVMLTPFRDHDIDLVRLRGSLDRAFADAGLTPDDFETGVVIMTGAAARRDNARAIVEALSLETGDIISAAAGDHLEAALAASGSGAVERSRREMQRILNVDIGGATTKFALVESGRVVETAAIASGGRQVVFDKDNRIVRLEDFARTHAQRCGLNWRLGAAVDRKDMVTVAERMADDIFTVLRGEDMLPVVRGQVLTGSFRPFRSFDGIMFSGGVAEYIYNREKRDFGDLGLLLGRSIASRTENGLLPAPLLPAGECIRATVLGCSEYSVQMSGVTSCITSHAALLPRRNLQVLQPGFDFAGDIDTASLAHAIASHREAFGDSDPDKEVAYAFRWRGDAEHVRIAAFAKAIVEAFADRIAAATNLYFLIEGDAALSLGAVLREELGVMNEILIIDGIVLRDFDYVDIGRLRLPSGMVPVTIKSLLFGSAP